MIVSTTFMVIGMEIGTSAVVVENVDALINIEYLPLLVSALYQGSVKAAEEVDLDGDLLDRDPVALHFVLELQPELRRNFISRMAERNRAIVPEDPYMLVE